MNRSFLLLVTILVTGCASQKSSIYSEAAEKIDDFEFRSPIVHEVMWQRIKAPFELKEKEVEVKSDIDLSSCVLELERNQKNESRVPPTKSKLFATIELVDCMHLKGWRPTVIEALIITH